MAKSIAQTNLEKLQKEFAEYKKRIPEVMQECIDEYQLDLCEDGVADFCRRIGVDTPVIEIDAYVTTTLYQVSMKGRRSQYGVDFDEDEHTKLVTAIENAFAPIVSEYGAFLEVEVNQDY